MQLSLATVILGLAAFAAALPQDSTIVARQNQNRPVPSGNCCVAETNLKQDSCKAANGQAGRCVPGGNNCEFLSTHLLSFMFRKMLMPSINRRRRAQLHCPVQPGLRQQRH